MTWIDWAIVSILLFAALHGLRRGIIAALIGAAGVIVAYLAASIWYRPLASLLADGTHLARSWANTIAYGALLMSVYILIGTIATIVADSYALTGPRRMLGLLAGAVKGGLLSAALVGLLLASPVGGRAEEDARRSALAPLALRVQQGGAQSLARVLPDSIHPFGAQEMRF